MKTPPKMPTSEECTKRERVGHNMFACWYPQMGGYVSKAVVETSKPESHEEGEACFDMWIWHDGQFPFDDSGDRSKEVAFIHHCMPSQFIDFGSLILDLQNYYCVSKDENG